MTSKAVLDKLVTVAAAVSTPVVSLLIHLDVISATVGIDIGSIIAALVGGYHGGALVQRRATTDSPAEAGAAGTVPAHE